MSRELFKRSNKYMRKLFDVSTPVEECYQPEDYQNAFVLERLAEEGKQVDMHDVDLSGYAISPEEFWMMVEDDEEGLL